MNDEDIGRLKDEYIERLRSGGEPSIDEFVERASRADRAELREQLEETLAAWQGVAHVAQEGFDFAGLRYEVRNRLRSRSISARAIPHDAVRISKDSLEIIAGSSWTSQTIQHTTLGPDARPSSENEFESAFQRFKLAEGDLAGAEIRRTGTERIVIDLNKATRDSRVLLIDGRDRPVNVRMVRDFDENGRAIVDVSNLDSDIEFRIRIDKSGD